MSKIKKFAVVGAFALAFTFVGAHFAHATVMVPPNLMQGSSGDQVMNLQAAINAAGYTPALVVDGSFGPMTKAGVVWYQSAHGLTADGVVGPITAGSLNGASVPSVALCPNGNTLASNCMTPPSGPTGPTCPNGNLISNNCMPSGTVSGGAGTVDSYTLLSEFNNEAVGEDENDVIVKGFEVDVDSGSDLAFTSMKVWFENQDTGSSEDFNDYADSVSIWMDGTKVGEASVDDFTADDTSGTETDNSTSDSNDEWTKTINLAGAICHAGDTCEFDVAISAVSGIDSADSDSDDWDADVTNVRYEDGTGAIISEDPALAVTAFNFGTFADAADIEMKVSLSSDNPDGQIIDVSDSSETTDVELLKFDVEAVGTDIEIHDIPVLLTVSQPTVAASDDVDFIVNTLKLTVNGDEFTETVSTSTAATVATITFDNIDVTVNEGDSLEFTVSADLNDTQANEFSDGDTIKAEVRSAEVDAIDADDETGENISDTDATGTALGNTMAAYASGVKVTLVSTDEGTVSESTGANNDAGAFTIVFNVEAFDSTIYVSDTAVATTATDAAIATATSITGDLYRITQAGTATVDDLSASITYDNTTNAPQSGNGNITLEDGESTNVTLYVVRTNDDLGDAGIFQAFLGAVGWNTGDSATVYNNYYFDLQDFKTDPLYIN